MSKTVFLFIDNDGDYDAMSFEQNYDVQKVYTEMVTEGVTRKKLPIEDDWTVDIKIVEFGEVDPEFESFIINELCDYDALKASNIYRVDTNG